MPKWNFAATLAMRPEGHAVQVALRSFVAALALYDAFVAATGRAEGYALKWPNDVLLNGGKVAGILLESTGVGQGVQSLAIGIGVNLAEAPSAAEVEARAVRPVSLLGETGTAISPEDFLPLLASEFAKHENSLTTYGFAPIRAAWLDRAARLGQEITARTSTVSHKGTFETVDDHGALVLKTPKGRITIPAADVFF